MGYRHVGSGLDEDAELLLGAFQAADVPNEVRQRDDPDVLRRWVEIRHGDDTWHVATVAARDVVLGEHGVDPTALALQRSSVVTEAGLVLASSAPV